jgi:hypothetical protein
VLVDEKKGKRKEKLHAMNMLSSKLREPFNMYLQPSFVGRRSMQGTYICHC